MVQKRQEWWRDSNREDVVSFLSRVSVAKECWATNPRDLIYAYLGVLGDPNIVIRPDYNMTPRNTFIAAARAIIEGTRNLDMLGIVFRHNRPAGPEDKYYWYICSESTVAGDRLKRHNLMPSWVPEWSTTQRGVPLSLRSTPNSFMACGPLQQIQRSTGSDPQLIVRGKVIDVVSLCDTRAYELYIGTVFNIQDFLRLDDTIIRIMSDQGSVEAWRERHLEKRRANRPFYNELDRIFYNVVYTFVISQLPRASAPMQPIRERFLKVVLANGACPGNTFLQDEAMKGLSDERISELLRVYDISPTLTETQHGEPQLHEVQLAIRALMQYSNVAMHRRVFKCVSGRLGLGYLGIQETDIIAILHGSRTPVVLKLQKNGTYKFKGQCYLEGVMQGEAVTWSEDEADDFIIE